MCVNTHDFTVFKMYSKNSFNSLCSENAWNSSSMCMAGSTYSFCSYNFLSVQICTIKLLDYSFRAPTLWKISSYTHHRGPLLAWFQLKKKKLLVIFINKQTAHFCSVTEFWAYHSQVLKSVSKKTVTHFLLYRVANV